MRTRKISNGWRSWILTHPLEVIKNLTICRKASISGAAIRVLQMQSISIRPNIRVLMAPDWPIIMIPEIMSVLRADISLRLQIRVQARRMWIWRNLKGWRVSHRRVRFRFRNPSGSLRLQRLMMHCRSRHWIRILHLSYLRRFASSEQVHFPIGAPILRRQLSTPMVSMSETVHLPATVHWKRWSSSSWLIRISRQRQSGPIVSRIVRVWPMFPSEMTVWGCRMWEIL